MDHAALPAAMAETHARHDLTVITGPTDPEGPFGGRMVTVRRWRRDEVTNGMVLAAFIWPAVTWPAPRTQDLLSLWPVCAVTMQPVWEHGESGRIYLGQQVTFVFEDDCVSDSGPAEDYVWQLIELGRLVP